MPSVRATYEITIDVAGDGVMVDVTADIDAGGRLFGSERGGVSTAILAPAKAGGLDFLLNNAAGTYSALRAGRTVVVTATYDSTTRSVWRGRISRPQFVHLGIDPYVAITALGPLAALVGKSVSTPLYQDVTTGEAIEVLLDAAGFPQNAGDYLLSLAPDGYWPLGEASGDAIDYSGNGNDGTVTIGAGARAAAALDDEGDGGLDFDADVTAATVPTDATNSGIFNGGGAFAAILTVASAGESGAGIIFSKPTGSSNTQTRLRTQSLSGGRVHLRFDRGYSTTGGAWTTSGTGKIVVGNPTALLLLHNDDDVANDPTIHLYDLVSGVLTTLTVGGGISESTTPVGAAGSDASASFVIGNGGLGFDGVIDEVAVWKGAQPTLAQFRQWIDRVLQARRRIDTGKTVIDWYWEAEADAFPALQTLVNTEGPGAKLYEDAGGALVFKRRTARMEESTGNTSQVTLRSSGTEPLLSRPFASDPGDRDVFNVADITVNRRSLASLAVVWSLGESLTLSVGQSRSFTVTASGGPMYGAIAPALTTDYTVSGGTVSTALDRTSGGVVTLTVTALTGAPTVTGLQMRAQVAALDGSTAIPSQIDASASIAEFGRIPWSQPIRAEISAQDAQDMADAIVGWHKDGRPGVTFGVMASAAEARLEAVLDREIGHRITVVEAINGVSSDFYVESVAHDVSAPAAHRTTLVASEALPQTYGLWDAGDWDDALWAW